MRLNPKAMACALGAIWGAALLLVGLAHQFWPGYGQAFLDLAASIYPGYHPGGGGQVMLGTLYGVLDGGVGGVLIAVLYNRLAQASTAG